MDRIPPKDRFSHHANSTSVAPGIVTEAIFKYVLIPGCRPPIPKDAVLGRSEATQAVFIYVSDRSFLVKAS